jgi:hypothetical protein
VPGVIDSTGVGGKECHSERPPQRVSHAPRPRRPSRRRFCSCARTPPDTRGTTMGDHVVVRLTARLPTPLPPAGSQGARRAWAHPRPCRPSRRRMRPSARSTSRQRSRLAAFRRAPVYASTATQRNSCHVSAAARMRSTSAGVSSSSDPLERLTLRLIVKHDSQVADNKRFRPGVKERERKS